MISFVYFDLLASEDESSSPLDSHYIKLKSEIVPLDVDSPDFGTLSKYLKNTHADTHSSYELEILQVIFSADSLSIFSINLVQFCLSVLLLMFNFYYRRLKLLEKEKIRDSNHSRNFQIVGFFGTGHVLQIMLGFFHKVSFFYYLYISDSFIFSVQL